MLEKDGALHVLDPDSRRDCGASRWCRRGSNRMLAAAAPHRTLYVQDGTDLAGGGYMLWAWTPEKSGSAPNCRTSNGLTGVEG